MLAALCPSPIYVASSADVLDLEAMLPLPNGVDDSVISPARGVLSSGVEYPDAGSGDTGEPWRWVRCDEVLDVVPVPQP